MARFVNSKAIAKYWVMMSKKDQYAPSEIYERILKTLKKHGDYMPFSEISWLSLLVKKQDKVYFPIEQDKRPNWRKISWDYKKKLQ